MMPLPPISTLFPYTTLFRSSLGSTAYAKGNSIAFAGTPDLHTAAHEAAHVVQQHGGVQLKGGIGEADRKSTRLNSSHMSISYAVFCLKKKNNTYLDISDMHL